MFSRFNIFSLQKIPNKKSHSHNTICNFKASRLYFREGGGGLYVNRFAGGNTIFSYQYILEGKEKNTSLAYLLYYTLPVGFAPTSASQCYIRGVIKKFVD